MPVSGEIVEVNAALGDNPALVNTEPYGRGWFYKIKLSQPGEADALFADGCAVAQVGKETFRVIKDTVDEVITA